MLVRDLSGPVTASKADWLGGTTWLGFTPTSGDLNARNTCQGTVQRQFRGGYVIEYITESFDDPNPGFENDPEVLQARNNHEELKGRFIAVHKLRYTSRPLQRILSKGEYEHLQDVWAKGGNRFRWSVAFPIIESFEVVGKPNAKEILGEEAYWRLYRHSSATLRPLNDNERAAIANLELERKEAKNAWIAIEDEFPAAAGSDINQRTIRVINADLGDRALEGWTEERKAQIRRRAAWIADKFIGMRKKAGSLVCDHGRFDPVNVFDLTIVNPRSMLDVHHKYPLDEGVRYTNVEDFALLCPTCHRAEHLRLKLNLSSGRRA